MKQCLLKMGLLAALLAPPAHAATLYWNPFGSYGGSASWDYDNTVYWYNGSTNLKWTDTTGADIAIFQGTGNSPPYTVTVVGNVTVNKLQFENANYGGSGGITGGIITLAGAAPAIRAGNAGQYDTTINSTLAGVNGMILSLGNGNATTLHLGGSNTVTGGVNFTSSTGTVILGSPTALGTGNALTMSAYNSSFVAVLDLNGNNQGVGDLTGDAYSIIQNGLASTTSTLTVNQAGNTTFAGTLRNNGGAGGTLALTKDGAGTLTLTGPATYTGATTINAGTLAYSNGAATTFSLPSATLSGNGSLIATAGVLQFNGNMTLGGGQSYIQNGASGLYKGLEAVAASTTITAASITMTGDLGKRASVGNTVALDTSAANGAINLNASIGRSNVWYNLAGFAANAGTGALNVTGTNGYGQWDSPVSLTGALNITTDLARTGPAVFHATANGTISGNLGVNQSIYGFNDFNVDGGATLTVSGRVDGVSGVSWGGINKLGAGTLSLTNTANTYGQGLQINGGTVEFSNNALRPHNPANTSSTGYAADFLGSGTLRWGAGNTTDISTNGQVRIGDGVTATFDTNGSSPTFATAISVGTLKTGALTKAGAGTLTLTAANTYTGATTVNGGILAYQNAYASTSHSIAAGATLEFNVAAGAADRAATTFSGAGTLVKTGAGILRWGSAPTTFSLGSGGMIDVQGGTLEGSSGGNEVWTANKADLNVAAGAIFDGIEGAIFVDVLTGSGTIKSGYSGYPSTITFGVDNGSGTFNGVLANSVVAGNYTKAGSGTQTLAAATTYTGVTTVSGGTLVYQSSYASPSHVIAAGGTLEFNVASGTVDRASTTFSGGGTLLKTGAGVLVWGGTIATFNLSSGALIDVREGQFTAGSNNNEVWTNNKADLNVAAGATFTGVEAAVFVDALTGAGTIKSGYPGAYASTITFGVDGGSGTFSGVLTDANAAGNFIKAGAGTQILSGDNTYTGVTTVNGGVLQIGDGGTTGTLGTGAVTDNASLVFNRSNALTVAHNIGGTGTLTQAGPGTLMLSGANSYAGTTYVNQGALLLNGSTSTAGLIAVSAGASFGGGGSGGAATFAGAGEFSPGAVDMSDNQLDLTGLSLAGATVLKYELGTPSAVADFWYDHVNLSGPLTLAGSLRITAINDANTSFGTPVAGDRWLLMAYPTGGGMLTDNGLTVDTANSPALSSGLVYQVDTSIDGAVYLTVAVPEAGTGVLTVLGLLIVWARRRG